MRAWGCGGLYFPNLTPHAPRGAVQRQFEDSAELRRSRDAALHDLSRARDKLLECEAVIRTLTDRVQADTALVGSGSAMSPLRSPLRASR